MRPVNIPGYVQELRDGNVITQQRRIDVIRKQYERMSKGAPEVSIVIPAYNEERYILSTLQSITANETNRPVEIIVVNNNSTDSTEQLVTATGITCITENRRGVTAARNAGLAAAHAPLVLNADADSIYPTGWIDELVDPISRSATICLTYGRYAFIPIGQTGRLMYFLYENVVDCLRFLKKTFREEAVNVGGFSSCFRKEQALQVNGFDHPVGANEDGYLALKLRNKGFGKLYPVMTAGSIAWTTDRRIQIDGGFAKGLQKRIKKTFLD